MTQHVADNVPADTGDTNAHAFMLELVLVPEELESIVPGVYVGLQSKARPEDQVIVFVIKTAIVHPKTGVS